MLFWIIQIELTARNNHGRTPCQHGHKYIVEVSGWTAFHLLEWLYNAILCYIIQPLYHLCVAAKVLLTLKNFCAFENQNKTENSAKTAKT